MLVAEIVVENPTECRGCRKVVPPWIAQDVDPPIADEALSADQPGLLVGGLATPGAHMAGMASVGRRRGGRRWRPRRAEETARVRRVLGLDEMSRVCQSKAPWVARWGAVLSVISGRLP